MSNSKAPGGGLNAFYMLRDAIFAIPALHMASGEVDYRAIVLPTYLDGYMSRTDFKASRNATDS